MVPRAEASGDESGKYINKRGEGGVVGSLQRVEREIPKNRFFHFPAMAEGEGGGGSGSNNANVDTIKSERAVWLMKCPPVVSRCLSSSPASNSPRPVAKVIVSLDPLLSNDDDDSPPQVLYLFLLLYFVVRLLSLSLSTPECGRTITHFDLLIYLLSL